MQHRLERGTADPSSITAQGAPRAVAAAGLPAGGPPTIIEYSRNEWIGNRTPVNRFSLNPGAEYYSLSEPGPAPTMFAAGDLPVLTGSGVDPAMLRWVAWPLRTTAAFSSSRSEVSLLIEASLQGDPDSWQGASLVSAEGRAALDVYWSKIATWVNTPVDVTSSNAEPTAEEMAAFYPSEPASE
jgi:hypothetical protein